MTPYALIGGSYALAYQVIFEFLRGGHEGNNDTPKVFAHTITLTFLGGVAGLMFGGLPKYAAAGAVASFFNFAPMSWWLYKHGKFNSSARPVNIFY